MRVRLKFLFQMEGRQQAKMDSSTRRLYHPGLLVAALFLSIVLAITSNAQKTHQPPASDKRPNVGQKLFVSSCAGCHGLDGRGGERAPNIAGREKVQRLADADLVRIIQQGVPGTGMPAFHSLSLADVKALVAHLRVLQGNGQTVKLPGRPVNGKALFFGNAGCSSCHMVQGAGGFLGSDLSTFAGTHSVEQIRAAITNPDQNAGPQSRTAIVTTHDGKKYSGRVRNEDNFSVQMQMSDGTFHFFSKAELESLEYTPKSIMPSDYGSLLTPAEMNDLISFLMTLGKAGHAETGPEFED
jgi:cytochrome c oxidase cbb3-type subunit III